MQTFIEIFEDSQDRKDGRRIYPGRKHFLAENNIRPEPDQLIHAVSYSIFEQRMEKEKIIEVYLDQLCIAAAFYYPDKFQDAVIHMLTEELLGQVILSEMKLTFHKERWVNELLLANLIDEIIDDLMEGSYTKEIRRRSAHRLLQYFTRKLDRN